MLTLVTAFYTVKSKNCINKLKIWMKYMIDNVNNYNLVIYTDQYSLYFFDEVMETIDNNPRIRLILKPLISLESYKYEEKWKSNSRRYSLVNVNDWQLNMLWNEKVNFVNDAYTNKYFDTEWYGWTDINYWRNRENIDLNSYDELNWPNNDKLDVLNKEKVYYGRVNNNSTYFWRLIKFIKQGYQTPIDQNSINSGFFIINKDKIDWWYNTYNKQLQELFNKYVFIKDDLLVTINCIANYIEHFEIVTEHDIRYDNNFLFQRYLL